MTLRDVVRRDLRSGFQIRGGTWSTLRILLVIVLPGYYVIDSLNGPEADFIRGVVAAGGALPSHDNAFIIILGLLIGLLIPLLTMLDASDAIVAERNERTMKILLTLPNSRSDVYFGKVVGRSLFVLTPLLISLAVLGGFQVLVGEAAWEPLLGLTALSSMLVVCFVTIGVAISTMTKNTRAAVQTGIGAYFLLGPVWRVIEFAFVILGSTYRLDFITGIALLVGEFGSPVWAYEIAVVSLLDPGTRPPTMIGYGDTIFATSWFSTGVILAWLIVSVLIGYIVFDRADLG